MTQKCKHCVKEKPKPFDFHFETFISITSYIMQLLGKLHGHFFTNLASPLAFEYWNSTKHIKGIRNWGKHLITNIEIDSKGKSGGEFYGIFLMHHYS